MTQETQQNFNQHDALVIFLRAVLAAPVEGEVFVAASAYPKKGPGAKSAMKHTYADTHEALASAVLDMSSNGNDSYFALGRYVPHATARGLPGRQGRSVRALKSVWMDIDCGEAKAAAGHGYASKKEAVAAMFHFVERCNLPEPTHVVDSGGGIHAYWALRAEVAPDEWKRVAGMLKDMADAHRFLADPARTADVASVMRAPLTRNYKLETARDAKIMLSRAPVQFSTLAQALTLVHAHHFGQVGQSARILLPADPGNLLPGTHNQRPPETAEEISQVEAMLASIPADCDYPVWRNALWAVASTGWSCAEKLARKWSASAPGKFNEAAFQAAWKSFDPARGIGLGPLMRYAVRNGYRADEPERFAWTGGDVENGRRFADTFRGQILFVPELGSELIFDQKAGWVSAPSSAAEGAAKYIRDQMHKESVELYKAASDSPLTKRAALEVARVSKAPHLRAMIQMAASEPGMTRSLNEFDADPMQLGVTNGVLDLERRVLLHVSPDSLVTKRCNAVYDPTATCPQWDQFLIDVQPDPDVRELLQRWAGYCLTGAVREHKFVFLHGGGENGKSVFVEQFAWVMGDYAKKVATEMFMRHQRNPQAPSPDIVSLRGMRFVYANETEEGRKLDEARIKDMTGGDTLTGRMPYAKADITFLATFKVTLVGNHKPEISDNSHGMWRRICLVPFDVTIPAHKRDGKLPEKLKQEGSGILNWALAGLHKYLSRGGLAIPKVIEVATAAYRDEQDIIGEWIRDHCMTGPGRKTKKDGAYRAYVKWCSQNGHHPLANQRFTRRLGERNYPLLSDKRTIGGLELNQDGVMAAQS
jgi:P4 family phage/plasmid primase-like protien